MWLHQKGGELSRSLADLFINELLWDLHLSWCLFFFFFLNLFVFLLIQTKTCNNCKFEDFLYLIL